MYIHFWCFWVEIWQNCWMKICPIWIRPKWSFVKSVPGSRWTSAPDSCTETRRLEMVFEYINILETVAKYLYRNWQNIFQNIANEFWIPTLWYTLAWFNLTTHLLHSGDDTTWPRRQVNTPICNMYVIYIYKRIFCGGKTHIHVTMHIWSIYTCYFFRKKPHTRAGFEPGSSVPRAPRRQCYTYI
jgi:hypothetical protein